MALAWLSFPPLKVLTILSSSLTSSGSKTLLPVLSCSETDDVSSLLLLVTTEAAPPYWVIETGSSGKFPPDSNEMVHRASGLSLSQDSASSAVPVPPV